MRRIHEVQQIDTFGKAIRKLAFDFTSGRQHAPLGRDLLAFIPASFLAGLLGVLAVGNPVAAPEWFFVLGSLFGTIAVGFAVWGSATILWSSRRYGREQSQFAELSRQLGRAARAFFRAGQALAPCVVFLLAATLSLAFPGVALLAGFLTPILAVAFAAIPGLVLVARPDDAVLMHFVPARSLNPSRSHLKNFRIGWRFGDRMASVRAVISDRNQPLPEPARDIAKSLDCGGLVRPRADPLVWDAMGIARLRLKGTRPIVVAALPVASLAWLLAALAPTDRLPPLPRPGNALHLADMPSDSDQPSTPIKPEEDAQTSSSAPPEDRSVGTDPQPEDSGGRMAAEAAGSGEDQSGSDQAQDGSAQDDATDGNHGSNGADTAEAGSDGAEKGATGPGDDAEGTSGSAQGNDRAASYGADGDDTNGETGRDDTSDGSDQTGKGEGTTGGSSQGQAGASDGTGTQSGEGSDARRDGNGAETVPSGGGNGAPSGDGGQTPGETGAQAGEAGADPSNPSSEAADAGGGGSAGAGETGTGTSDPSTSDTGTDATDNAGTGATGSASADGASNGPGQSGEGPTDAATGNTASGDYGTDDDIPGSGATGSTPEDPASEGTSEEAATQADRGGSAADASTEGADQEAAPERGDPADNDETVSTSLGQSADDLSQAGRDDAQPGAQGMSGEASATGGRPDGAEDGVQGLSPQQGEFGGREQEAQAGGEAPDVVDAGAGPDEGGDQGRTMSDDAESGTQTGAVLPGQSFTEGGETLTVGAPAALFAAPGEAPPVVLRELGPEALEPMPVSPQALPRQRLPAWIADLYD